MINKANNEGGGTTLRFTLRRKGRHFLTCISLTFMCLGFSALSVAGSDVDTGNATVNSVVLSSTPSAKVAIIIDDIGYSWHQGSRAIALPGSITYAIIPNSPNAHFFAVQARKYKKEVMLHAPMSNIHNIPVGKNGLTESMGETRFKDTLISSLDSVPHIRGVNNHMGSLLTQKALPMEWLMEALQERQLYFIDSRTTSHSVAWNVAQSFNIPSLKRDVFLDHEATPSFIHQQFQKLTSLAKKRGYAIAIAHPYPETISYLERHLPLLAEQGIQLVSVSELVHSHSPNLMPQKHTKM